MNILLWIIFGGLAGWIATIITGSNSRFGIIGNIIIGIIGAFIGGWLANVFGVREGSERPTTVRSFIIAVVGAIVLLFILNLIF